MPSVRGRKLRTCTRHTTTGSITKWVVDQFLPPVFLLYVFSAVCCDPELYPHRGVAGGVMVFSSSFAVLCVVCFVFLNLDCRPSGGGGPGGRELLLVKTFGCGSLQLISTADGVYLTEYVYV